MNEPIMSGGTSAAVNAPAISKPFYGHSTENQNVNCQSGVNGVSMPVYTQFTENQNIKPQMSFKGANGVQMAMPMPREFNGKLYYGTDDVAKIVGVTRQTVSHWQNTLYFDCPLFTADARAHDGRYLYDVERVMQLKAVYHPNWTRGGYEPAPEPTDNTQTRIAEAKRFFNLLFGGVRAEAFSYLWTKQGEARATYPFDVSVTANLAKMAVKAIELNDQGADIYVGVNLTSEPPTGNDRAKTEQVTMQTATVCDLDVEGGNHVSTEAKKYPPTLEVAKKFVPFELSFLVDSGYGGHGYCRYKEPITITDENRTACIERNKKYIGVIRASAGEYSKAVDGVGDLPRVLRVPGTFNYKPIGESKEPPQNPPLCRLVEVSDVQYTPEDIDARLNALTPSQEPAQSKPEPTTETSARRSNVDYAEDSPELKRFRIEHMLPYINVVKGEHDKWIDVGFGLYNEGMELADWQRWSRTQPEFKEGECEYRWGTFHNEPRGITIATLYMWASEGGYSERDTQREWYQLHPELSNRHTGGHEDNDGLIYDGTTGWTNESENFSTETKSATDKEYIRTRDKIRSCPCDLRIPTNFVFGATGIFQEVQGKNNEVKLLPVTKTPIVPTKKYREPAKGCIEYAFAILSDGEWQGVEVDGASLADPRELAKILSKHGALVVDNKRLCDFITSIIALNPELPKLKSYNQTGWTDDDCENFALPAENSDTVIRRAGFNYEKIFKPKGNADKWKQKFIEVAEQGGAPAHVVIGAACAAPLVKPLEIPNIQVHLHGRRSIGKTPMLKFAVSIYGDTSIGALSYTFSATLKSRLETACAFSGLPVIGEELESIPKKEAEKLPQDIYNYSLGTYPQALRKDGTLRDPKLFDGARLTSGEHELARLNANGGELKRVLPIRCSNLLEDEFASDLYGFLSKNHGLFGAQWIQYIKRNISAIRGVFHKAYKQAKHRTDIDSNQLKILVASAVAYQFFKICIGLQENGNYGEILDDIDDIIRTLPTAAELDDTARAIQFLKSFVAGHEKFFVHEANKPEYDNDFTQTTPECYGKIFKNGEVAFLPHAFTEILETKGGFTSADKLRAEFYDRDYLRHVNGKYTYPTRFNGKNLKMIRFNPDIISTAEKETHDEDETSHPYY